MVRKRVGAPGVSRPNGNAPPEVLLSAHLLGLGNAPDSRVGNAAGDTAEGTGGACQGCVRVPAGIHDAFGQAPSYCLAAASAGVTGKRLLSAALSAGIDLSEIEVAATSDAYRLRTEYCPAKWLEKTIERARAIRLGSAAKAYLASPGPDAEAALSEALGAPKHQSASMHTANDAMVSLERQLEELQKASAAGTLVRSGYQWLDSMVDHLLPGDLTVVAARTSVGKSMWALNVADQVAQQRHKVFVFSMEMPKERVIGRLFSISNECPSPRNPNALRAAAVGYTHDIEICERACLSTADIVSIVAASASRPRLVVVDYLGLMDHGGEESRGRSFTEATAIGNSVKRLRAAGREFGFHTVLLSQVNRAGAEEEPELHHLRGSGDIEQDADHVVFLWKRGEELWLNLAKNRTTGMTGKRKLRAVGDSCRIVEA